MGCRHIVDWSATGQRLVSSNQRLSATDWRLIGDLLATGRRLDGDRSSIIFLNKVFGKNTTISV